MVVVKGLGVLEVFMNAEEGAAFITDNLMFISCNGDTSSGILFTMDNKDPSCKFLLSLSPSGKLLLQDYRGLYLRCALPTGIQCVELESPADDPLCQSEPYFEGEKVALKAANGMFLCRVFHRFHYIEASRPNPDPCCRFRLILGDLLYPGFDISQVCSNTFIDAKLQPCVVKKDGFVNSTNEPKVHTFTLNWDVRTVQSTTWYRVWGMDCKSSYDFNLVGIRGTVGYDGSYKKLTSLRHIIHEERNATVTIPPNWKATASLIVSKRDALEIPFVATIHKLKADGNSVILHEKGKWKGLAYDGITLEIKQEEVKDETKKCAVL